MKDTPLDLLRRLVDTEAASSLHREGVTEKDYPALNAFRSGLLQGLAKTAKEILEKEAGDGEAGANLPT